MSVAGESPTMAGLAENMLGISNEDEGKTTRVECSTTASQEPFTLEVLLYRSKGVVERDKKTRSRETAF